MPSPSGGGTPPSILAAAPVAMGLCRGTIVAAGQGAGRLITTASKFRNTDIVIMGIIPIGVIGFGVDLLMRRTGRIVMPWKGKG